MNASINIGVSQVDTRQYGSILPPLAGPPWDIQAMGRIARNLAGVAAPKLLPNDTARAKDVLAALADAAVRITEGLVIISFSGHGYPSRGANVQGWCLYDRVLTELEIKQALLRFGKGVRVLVVADCCYAMPEEGLLGAFKRWFWGAGRPAPAVVKCVPKKDVALISRSPAAPKPLLGAVATPGNYRCAVMWFASCGSMQKAFDGAQGSVFTRAMEISFEHGERWTYEQLCGVVRQSVNSKQTPECALITSGETDGNWGTGSIAFR